MDKTLFINKKACLYDSGHLYIYDIRLAYKINKVLKTYDNGNYSFKQGEEASFRLPKTWSSDQTYSFLLSNLGKKSTQIEKAIDRVGA